MMEQSSSKRFFQMFKTLHFPQAEICTHTMFYSIRLVRADEGSTLLHISINAPYFRWFSVVPEKHFLELPKCSSEKKIYVRGT